MTYYYVMRTYTFRSSNSVFRLGSVPERLLFPRNLTILIKCKRKHRRIKKGLGFFLGGGGVWVWGGLALLWIKHKSTMITKEGIDQDLQAMGTKCSTLA